MDLAALPASQVCTHITHRASTAGPGLTKQSAGTAEPEPSSTRSPGTSRAASMVDHLPSRLQVARGLREALRAATASPALVVSYLQHRGQQHGRFRHSWHGEPCEGCMLSALSQCQDAIGTWRITEMASGNHDERYKIIRSCNKVTTATCITFIHQRFIVSTKVSNPSHSM